MKNGSWQTLATQGIHTHDELRCLGTALVQSLIWHQTFCTDLKTANFRLVTQ
jgi:hypothetical protein